MPSPRPRRRAVGPAGARPPASPGRPASGELERDPDEESDRRDPDEHLVADRPPHHDRGV